MTNVVLESYFLDLLLVSTVKPRLFDQWSTKKNYFIFM